MANLSKKKIWVRVIRKDLEPGNQNDEKSEVFSYDMSEGQTGEKIKQDVLCKCNLAHLENVVVKLRNHRGSLVPFTRNLPSNTSTNPYSLEVVNVHQYTSGIKKKYVKASPRSVKIKCYSQTMDEKVTDILSRIEKLENTAPELDKRRDAKINTEIKDMEQMLNFLRKRMQDSDQAHWQGMFKKNPLW